MSRVSTVHYGLMLAQAAALRSTCPRRQVGAVLTQAGEIVATGYNGSSPGLPHCEDVGVGCLMSDGHCVRTTHAEQNALGRGRRGDTLYCTTQPCLMCLKLALANGVLAIYYIEPYYSPERDLFVADAKLKHMLRHVTDGPRLSVSCGGEIFIRTYPRCITERTDA